MRTWWLELTKREQWLILIGILTIAITLIYIFFWLPLSQAATNEQQKVQSQIKLLRWIQQANQRIATARANGADLTSTNIPNLLSVSESAFSACHLSQYIRSVEQLKENEVSLIFQEAPFDRWIQCIQNLTKHEGIRTKELQATASDTSGLVNAKISLTYRLT